VLGISLKNPEDILDGAQHMDLSIGGADHRLLPHIGADDIGRGAMGIDVIRAILAIVFDDEDQGVIRIGAVCHRLDHFADGRVIVGLQSLRCIHSAMGRAEAAHVVVGDSHDRQAGQLAVLDVQVEFPFPLVVAPKVRLCQLTGTLRFPPSDS
jgi:hypothetical protein